MLPVLRKLSHLKEGSNSEPKNILCTLPEKQVPEGSNIVLLKLDESKLQKRSGGSFLSSPRLARTSIWGNTRAEPQGTSQGQQLEEGSSQVLRRSNQSKYCPQKNLYLCQVVGEEAGWSRDWNPCALRSLARAGRY